MSSSEQAPEPTMDEILASIRKIISDDEPGDSPQTEAAAPEASPDEGALAEDLANALSDTQAEAEAAEDILDLTEVVPEPEKAESPELDALQAALGDALEASAAEAPEAPPEAISEPQAAAALAQPDTPDQPEAAAGGDVDISAVLAEAGIEQTAGADAAEPAPAMAMPEEAQEAEFSQDDAPGSEPVESEPAASGPATISEVLSAMDPATAESEPEAVMDAEMSETPEAPAEQPETGLLAEASIDKGVYTPDPEEAQAEAQAQTDADAGFSADDSPAEPAAPAIEMPVEEPGELAAAVDEPVQDNEPVEEAAPASEPETVEATAAPDSAAGEGRTLEDSVKDMLRPMLREWLDDNMERIVQEKVSAENLKGGGE